MFKQILVENEFLWVRYEREELKIRAWEDHQAVKAEAELKKLQVRNFFFTRVLGYIMYTHTKAALHMHVFQHRKHM